MSSDPSCLSACSWLHLLKSWSLRQTRGGSLLSSALVFNRRLIQRPDLPAPAPVTAGAQLCGGINLHNPVSTRTPDRRVVPAPPPPFGPPGVAAVVRTASLACQNAVKAQKFAQLQESSEESRFR